MDWFKRPFDPWEANCGVCKTGEAHQEQARPWSLDTDGRGVCSPCKVVVRCRHAQSRWEKVVKMVVGDPVHLDVVLSKEGTAGALFCYSAYMNQKLEMCMMNDALMFDKSMENFSLDVTDDEHDRCTKFMSSLEGKASYDYFDAMFLMPMAPKEKWDKKKLFSAFFDTIADDLDACRPENIRQVFCSQSVVLMLKYALDPCGAHSGLLQKLGTLNSRLVSPKQVRDILVSYGATPLTNEELFSLGAAQG